MNDVVDAYLADDKPTLEEVGKRFGMSWRKVQRVVSKTLSAEDYRAEKKLRYARSKMSDKNPMFQKFGDLHHNYKGVIDDGHGYLMLLKPAWFKSKRRHVFHHQVVFCQAAGMTHVPKGFCIHHINGDLKDNRVENLCLVSDAGHQAIHRYTPLSERLSIWELHEFMTWKSKKTTAS